MSKEEYNPLKSHQCNYYCKDPIHAVSMKGPEGEKFSSIEWVQRELDMLTGAALEVHKVKAAPELDTNNSEKNWTPNDGSPTPQGFLVFVSIRERKQK